VILYKRRVALAAKHFDQIFRQSSDYLNAMTKRQTSLTQATQARAKELKDRALSFLKSMSHAMKLPMLSPTRTMVPQRGTSQDSVVSSSTTSDESDSSSEDEY